MKSKEVAKYYDRTQFFYNLLWPQNALHYGFWFSGTKSISEAVNNTNKHLGELLRIKDNDNVLDAGCGIGATVLYLAKRYRADYWGITISDVQVAKANKLLKKLKLKSKVYFEKRDFNKTGFDANKFDKAYGVESISHAHDFRVVLSELYRILKKGGRLVVIDGFLKQKISNKVDKELYSQFLKGWALTNMATVSGFENDLKKSGFKNVVYQDMYSRVETSSKIIFIICVIVAPVTKIMSILRVIPKGIHEHIISGILQKKLADKKLATYGIFTAVKG